MGASRTTGGHSRQKALGNQPNIADLTSRHDANIIATSSSTIKAVVYFYVSLDPHPAHRDEMNKSYHIKIKVSFNSHI